MKRRVKSKCIIPVNTLSLSIRDSYIAKSSNQMYLKQTKEITKLEFGKLKNEYNELPYMKETYCNK